MERLYLLKYIIILLIPICISCEGESSEFKHGSSGSATKQQIVNNIKKMGEEPWDKTTYNDILSNQIPVLKLESDKNACTSLLNTTYGKVLVHDATAIMEGACEPQHKLLEKLIAELKLFNSAPGYQDVMTRKAKHEALEAFIRTLSTHQKVYSFEDKYDESFEDNKRKEAKKHLATNPTCRYIKSRLSNPEGSFSARRKAYGNSILEKYLQKSSWVKGDENVVKARLNAYKGDKSEWYKKIEEFKEKMRDLEN